MTSCSFGATQIRVLDKPPLKVILRVPGVHFEAGLSAERLPQRLAGLEDVSTMISLVRDVDENSGQIKVEHQGWDAHTTGSQPVVFDCFKRESQFT